jgi:uncharacterized membrane protein (TIGR02234 family)
VSRPGRAQRRQLTGAVLGSAVAGGLALLAGGQTWVTLSVVRPEPLPPLIAALSGATQAPSVPAAGLVLLAAAVALLAVRGAARLAVGVLMTLSGVALGVAGGRAVAGGLADAASGIRVGAGERVVEVATAWPLLTALAGVLGLLAGLLVVARGSGWPSMGGRFERTAVAAPPAPAPRTDEDRARLAWNALDRGEDPTS